MTDIDDPAPTDGNHRLEVRLVERFCPPLRRTEVERCVRASAAVFDGARVSTYLDVLIERTAVRRLKAAVALLDGEAHDRRRRVSIGQADDRTRSPRPPGPDGASSSR